MSKQKIAWSAAGLVAVLVLAGAGLAVALRTRSATRTAAAPAASATVSASPAPSPGADITGPLDLLLLGVDTRVSVPDWQPHSDAIMLLHLGAGLDSGYLYSLPRDLRVAIPAYPPAGFRGGRYKLTEAMSRGAKVPGSDKANVKQGYALLTKTIEQYTGIPTFQAGAILNFGGLSKLVDTLGGVTITVDQKVVSIHRRPDGTIRTMQAGGGGYVGPQAVYLPGTRKLVGWQAIDYARQRYTAGGDYTRQRHQRQIVRAVLSRARTAGLAGDQGKLRSVITALGETLVYVGGRSPIEYAYALRNLDPAKLTLVQLPGTAVGNGGGYLGEQLTSVGKGFLKAVSKDGAAAYLSTHPSLVNKG
ncbi:MAG: polyisoprenyl-teichoic acid--peptidoglycan teichoic acid transferase [Actinoplanes sp.]|jgi:LCP family protein required for cell wall assembly|nr:polyisoprenyl-teichoic acid--peptidoglycan teichoic acid transferase [Actinoplanes sp.]